jgi:hypothetical protein
MPEVEAHANEELNPTPYPILYNNVNVMDPLTDSTRSLSWTFNSTVAINN